jgi:Leucine-rich repeat (LRR) protein
MIESIDENVFEDNKRIEKIFLNSNKIKSIPSETFKNLKNLRNLEIKENICANLYLQEVSDSGRRLEVTKYVCGASLPYNFKKVERTLLV